MTKVGVFAPLPAPSRAPRVADELGPALEARGFTSVWFPEHVVTVPRPAAEPATGHADDDEPAGVLDPFVALSYVAARTERLRLGTGVALISQRQPLFTAKEVATLDQLSRGRVDLGVGVGWIDGEFEALGLRRRDRGKLADRTLAIMRAAWSPGATTYDDGEVAIGPVHSSPKPVQSPHPPIHVGGHSDAALRRTARVGQGWFAFDLDVARFSARLAALDRELAEVGRRRDELEITICPFREQPSPELVAAYVDAGATQVVLPATGLTDDDLDARLDELATIATGAG